MTKPKTKPKAADKPVLKIQLPTGWGELTAHQVSRVAYYLSLGLTVPEYLVNLAAELSGLSPRGSHVTDSGEILYWFYRRGDGNVLLGAEDVAAIAQALKWTTEELQPMAAPEISGYKTPDSAFYDLTLEQYMTADAACTAYLRHKTPEPLRMMVAALYHRKAFDPKTLQQEADRLAYLPSWQLEAVFLWFCGSKKILQDKFPYVFSSDGSGDPCTPGDEVLLGLLSSLNDGRVVDNDKIKKTEIYEVFHELNLKIKNSQKQR